MASAFLEIKEKAKLLIYEDDFKRVYKIGSCAHSTFQEMR